MKKLVVIQALRAIAANLVVVSHLSVIELAYGRGYVILPNLDMLGRLGVLLFFIISGFVMAMVASRSTDWRTFLWARMTRIYPLYWLYTALLLVAIALVPTLASTDEIQPSLLRSLLLLPDRALPLLHVGWSLIYELYFYLVFAIFLALRIGLLAGLLCWSALLLLPIQATGPFSAVALDPVAFSFIAGALLWIGLSRLQVRIPDLDLHSGLPERLGDASYSTYLSHVPVLSLFGVMFAAQPWHSSLAESLFVIGCLVLANVWGLVSYRYIERPLIEWTRLAGGRPTVAASKQSSLSQGF